MRQGHSGLMKVTSLFPRLPLQCPWTGHAVKPSEQYGGCSTVHNEVPWTHATRLCVWLLGRDGSRTWVKDSEALLHAMGDRAAHPAVLRACAKDLHDTLVTVPFTEWALCYGPMCVHFLQRTHAVAQATLEVKKNFSRK